MNEKALARCYSLFKNGDRILDVAQKLEISLEEVLGMIEYYKMLGKLIKVEKIDGEQIIVKKRKTTSKKAILDTNGIQKKSVCIISDTHLCNKKQQLTLINEVYKEAYKRGIDTILHCGDLLDGDYVRIRPHHRYEIFMHGFDEQTNYVIEMYPRVEGIVTKFIQGSHDETHVKNGGATPGLWIAKCRDDMEYLGQDNARVELNNTVYEIDHPGGGVAKSRSYKTQGAIEEMPAKNKPNIFLQGHYHKSYYMFYRNVHGFLIPSLIDQSAFMQKMKLSNIVGAYYLDVYSNNKGDVQWIDIEEQLFNKNDMNPNDYKKAKQLVINKQ